MVHARLVLEELLDGCEHLGPVRVRPRPDVHARRVHAGRERPEVQVVDRLDAGDPEDPLADVLRR